MANQVFEAVRTVLTVREYQDKELPGDVERRIAEAAHLTASAAQLAAQSMILAAWGDGVGSGWAGFGSFNEVVSAERFGSPLS